MLSVEFRFLLNERLNAFLAVRAQALHFRDAFEGAALRIEMKGFFHCPPLNAILLIPFARIVLHDALRFLEACEFHARAHPFFAFFKAR